MPWVYRLGECRVYRLVECRIQPGGGCISMAGYVFLNTAPPVGETAAGCCRQGAAECRVLPRAKEGVEGVEAVLRAVSLVEVSSC